MVTRNAKLLLFFLPKSAALIKTILYDFLKEKKRNKIYQFIGLMNHYQLLNDARVPCLKQKV